MSCIEMDDTLVFKRKQHKRFRSSYPCEEVGDFMPLLISILTLLSLVASHMGTIHRQRDSISE